MSLAEEFRQRAKEQIGGSSALFEADDFERSAKKQALAVIGQVNATVLEGLADVVDLLDTIATLGGSGSSPANERRVKLLKVNDAIRKAAAKRDWNEFDRLTAELAGIVGPGSGGPSGPA